MDGTNKDEVERLTGQMSDMSTEAGTPKVDISKSTLSVNAPVFVPRTFAPPVPAQPNFQHGYRAHDSDIGHPGDDEPQYRFHGTAMDRIKQAEQTLIANPGSFDDIMRPLTDSLTTAISNEKTLVSVAEEIFNQCVAEANFRYTGARLCNHLSHNLSVSFQGGNFMQQLLKRCHEEHNKREELAMIPSRREHLHGFMLFMAELLLNMTAPSGVRIAVLSTAVKELIVTLLNHPSDPSLKAVVQVLKLSGQYLEPEVDGAQGEAARPLDEVFTKIDALLQEETLNRSVRNMLGSVVTLRSKDWGRKDTGLNGTGINNPYAANNPYAQHNPYADMGPMGGYQNHIAGGPLGGGHSYPQGAPPYAAPTNEYSTYHLNNGGGAYYAEDGNSSGSDVYWSPPSDHNMYYPYGSGDPGNGFEGEFQGQDNFDDEMASAFEEFLLETGQVGQQQQ